jgi:hypothetical protein
LKRLLTNNNRTAAVISTNAMVPGTMSSVEFMLTHTCNFRPADGLDPEELELELIDFWCRRGI